MRKAILLSAIIFAAVGAAAQTSRISGVVLDADDDEPIIGATVTVTGTQNRTATDMDGKFTLGGVTAANKTVTVTYVGMATQTVPIGPDMTIKLHSEAKVLDDVVVVAFGKQKREAFTGSAGVIKSDDIMKVQVNDPITALDGKVSGVQITNDNDPSGEPSITIRGIGTINAESAPLIVVDGMPYNGYFRDINPADVDNISVLKDAASNALYGARGANGVILITTKSAQKGNTKVTVDMKWGANTDAKVDYNVIDNPGEYYEAHYMALRNYYTRARGMSLQEAHTTANSLMGQSANIGGLGYVVYSVPANENLIGINGKLNPNARLGNRVTYDGQTFMLAPDDWRAEGLRTGLRQEYNLSISGGTPKSTFYGSLGYLDNEGITKGSHLKRFTTKLKADFDAYSWLKVGANAGYTHTLSDAMADAFSVVHNIAPIYPLYIRDGYGNILQDAHGNCFDYGDGANAGLIRTVEKNNNSIQNDLLNVNRLESNTFNVQGYAIFSFLNDFTLTINGSAFVHEERSNYALNPYYGFQTQTGGWTWTEHKRKFDTNFQQLLNWNRDFGRNHVEVLLGHEYNRAKVTDLTGDKNGLAVYDENVELDGAIINGSIVGNTSDYNVEGWFARAQYDFDSRYFASASFRADGSSRFHPDHRWGKFWSVGGAWIATKEEWFPKTPAVNMLKYKISYGSQGNDNIKDFLYTDYYNIVNSNDEVAINFYRKGNPNITWETVSNLNTGLEFDLLTNRLGGSVEYYHRKTTDMLTTSQVPATMGYTYYWDNVGDMVNQGVELNLYATPIRSKNINWTINGNLSWNHNRITLLAPDRKQLDVDGHLGYQSGEFLYAEGLPLYTWYLPQYAGVGADGTSRWYSTADKADKDANGQPVTMNGQPVTSVYANSEYRECGTALPDLFGGFGTTFNAYGFDLSLQFNFTVGGKKMDYAYRTLMGSPYEGSTGYNIHRDVLLAWSESNTGSDIPRWQYGDTYSNASSDRFLTDASALTFKSINFGYTLPKKWTDAFRAASLRIYFTVDNVAYWTKRKGFDPRNVLTYGDDTLYSPMRTFMGGVNVVF